MPLKIIDDGKGKEVPAYTVLASPSVVTPGKFVIINPDVCTGCNSCVEVCPMDILAPNPVKGKPPYLLHYEECEHCGACVMHCPLADEGAIKYVAPPAWKIRWKRKETGEHFRLGMANPPAPNLKPPVSGGRTWKGGPTWGGKL